MIEIKIIVPEQAIPQPRPRARRLGNRVQVYVPKGKSASYRKAIKAAVEEQCPGLVIDGLCGMDIEFAMRMTTKNKKAMHGTPHLRRPDIDNMLKTTLDGLVDSGLLTDDSIVASLFAKKRWCREGEAAATYILIEYENPEGEETSPPGTH